MCERIKKKLPCFFFTRELKALQVTEDLWGDVEYLQVSVNAIHKNIMHKSKQINRCAMLVTVLSSGFGWFGWITRCSG